MSIKIPEDGEHWGLYIGPGGSVHRIASYCLDPTVTVEDMATGEQITGSIKGTKLEPFHALTNVSTTKLIEVIEKMAAQLKKVVEEKSGLCEQLIVQQERIEKLLEENHKLILKRGDPDA